MLLLFILNFVGLCSVWFWQVCDCVCFYWWF